MVLYLVYFYQRRLYQLNTNRLLSMLGYKLNEIVHNNNHNSKSILFDYVKKLVFLIQELIHTGSLIEIVSIQIRQAFASLFKTLIKYCSVLPSSSKLSKHDHI
jgi:hypothetical protein